MDQLKGLMAGGAAKAAAESSDAQYEKASELLDTSLNKCSRVKFLVDIMEKMGCKMPMGFYSIVQCEGQINGGFHVDEEDKPGVVLCQNHIADQEWMDRTVAHELIHAYDHCRNKIDWSSCEQHACSEVRAAALSGDCDWKYEFFRKNFGIAGQHQICTRRRAKLSIMNNPDCKGKEDECLEKVFQSCYYDVSPFREIP